MMNEEKIPGIEAPPFSWKARIKSFAYAWNGIMVFFKTGHNAWLHLAAGVVVTALSIYTRLSKWEVVVIVFAIVLVWITEMINTAIEKTMDMITVQKNPQVKIIKDIAAGAVLLASLAALITGCIVFIPKIFIL